MTGYGKGFLSSLSEFQYDLTTSTSTKKLFVEIAKNLT
jgi:hypothetical protein